MRFNKNKKSYGIENRNDMMHIHVKEVNKRSECNLLHDILNPHKRAKKSNSHYSPILDECTNNRKGRTKFNNFQIILGIVCSSNILIRMLVEKYILKYIL